MKTLILILLLFVSFPALSQSYIIPNKNARAMAVNICDDTLKISSLKTIKAIEILRHEPDFKIKKDIGAHNISVPLDLLTNGRYSVNVIWKNGDFILFTLINWRVTDHATAKFK